MSRAVAFAASLNVCCFPLSLPNSVRLGEGLGLALDLGLGGFANSHCRWALEHRQEVLASIQAEGG